MKIFNLCLFLVLVFIFILYFSFYLNNAKPLKVDTQKPAHLTLRVRVKMRKILCELASSTIW